MKQITIPKDKIIDLNTIPSYSSDDQWDIITNPTQIEEYVTKRNVARLIQDHVTPFTVEPLQIILQKNSVNAFGQQILDDDTNIHNLNLSKIQQVFFLELKKSQLIDSQPNNTISIKDMSSGFTKWREDTNTSPSQRHLDHYKCILTPDG